MFSDTQSFDTITSNFFRENFSILILKPNFSTPISRTSKSWQQFKNWVVPLCDRCSKPHAQTGKAQTDESFFIVGLPYADEGELSYNITSSVCLLDIWDTISCTKSILRLPTKGLIKAFSKSWRYNFKYGLLIQVRRWQNFEKISVSTIPLSDIFLKFCHFRRPIWVIFEIMLSPDHLLYKTIFGAKLGGTPTSHSGKNPASSIWTLP